MPTHSRRRSMFIPVPIALLLAAAGCGGSHGDADSSAAAGWRDTSADAVSRAVVGSGVAAVTSLRADGRLQTSTFDVASGKRLWAQPSVISGRPAAMGVAPPAVVGAADRAIVASVEPHSSGAALVGRDARTGAKRWSRTVGTTFGPARCGNLVCLSESTARRTADFAALDPVTGSQVWRMPGVAEVEWADARRVVVFRMSAHPTVEAHDLSSGKQLWTYPVENALGKGVNLSGGWSFGSLGDTLVGYLAPYQTRQDGPLSSFGFFSIRLADGRPVWTRRRLLRVYPSANPAVALITREVDNADRYGGFAHLDPRSGRSLREITATDAPKTDWWLAFPPDLSALGFLAHDKPGRMYDLKTGRAVAGHTRGWSFCSTKPTPLKINGQQGFYPIAALCAFDLKTGKKITPVSAPPGWYTGAVDGWRVWRDEGGALHGVHDANGTSPGMYS